MCPDSALVDASSDWVWSTQAHSSPSCTSPAASNIGRMCSGDPTSVVMHSHGLPGCFGTKMPDCKFNMHDLQQIDFDISMTDCAGTWAAPLWLTPDHWAGGGRSGEIDMVEMCPTSKISSNFAGASAPIGYQVHGWSGTSPDSFSGHVTVWKQKASDGVTGITVKLCSATEASDNSGSCSAAGGAFYPNIYGSNACANGYDCTFQFVSDIWNGYAGDAGYTGCTKGSSPNNKNCGFGVRKIRVKGPIFAGKCSALNSATTSPRRRQISPRRRRSGGQWQPCTRATCCDPNSAIQQICPSGDACQPCGSTACQCPDQALGEHVVI